MGQAAGGHRPTSSTAPTAPGYLKPGFRQVFVVAAEGGAPRQLTFGAFNDGGPIVWTPTGERAVRGREPQADWQT